MDLLTEILESAGVAPRLFGVHAIPADVAVRFPCEKSIGVHVVTHGVVHLHSPEISSPIEMRPGDIAMMARGCDHALAVPASLQGLRLSVIGEYTPTVSDHADRPALDCARIVSGAYQLWHRPLHPFLAAIPAWFIVPAHEIPTFSELGLAANLLAAEAGRKDPGNRIITNALLDAVLTYLFRALLERHHGAGWPAAARDPLVGRVITRLHADPSFDWTLETLATACGISRTQLANRFRGVMGDTPMSYLRTLRLQRAMRLLSETVWPLEKVAMAVGYQDAFGFSKLFKRELGLSPREFRRRDIHDKHSAWRFKSSPWRISQMSEPS